MPAPHVSVLRRPVRYADRSVHYEVTATVTARGDLPFVELFVISINDPLNPKADVLARVAVPYDLRVEADGVYARVDAATVVTVSGDPFVRIANVDELTSMPRDRVTAVRRGATEYLASTVSLVYDKISTADAASRQIVDRLSKLTLNYATHYGSFVTDPAQDYTLPITDRSVEAVLVSAFKSARDARVAAETARDAAQTARDACAAGDALLNAQIDKLVADVSFLEAARMVVTGLSETGSVVGGSCSVAPTATATQYVKTFVLDGGDPRSYESLLATKRADLRTARDSLAARAPQCEALARQLAQAEAGVVAARTAENAALREVYASCPTFNPNTV